MADKPPSVAQILKAQNGRPLEQYRKASQRLGTLALRRMGDVRQLRNAGSDIYFRQAEIAAIVELLIEGKPFDIDQYLKRAADCMDKISDNFQRQESAIHLPGRSN